MSDLDSLVMLIVASLFLCGAIIIGIASFRLPDPETIKELWHLYAVEFALVSVVLVPIYIGDSFLLIACIALTWRGLWELFQVYDKPGFGTIQWSTYIGSTIALSIIFLSDDHAIGAALIAFVMIIFIGLLFSKEKNNVLPVACIGIMLPVLPVLCILSLANKPQGFLWLFFIYLIVELNDSLAYLAGKIFGRHHPFPYLSPRKSTEGLFGGLIIATIVGVMLGMTLLDMSFLHALGAVFVILIGGLIGDFSTSALKRGQGVKDFPAIHGFHGGALDIHDAFLFAVPSFYLYFLWVIQ